MIVSQNKNNSINAVGTIYVDTTGNIGLQTTAGTAFTATFGLAQDHVISYLIVAA